MSIQLFFGLPGSGKTTIATAIALENSKKPNFNVYCNFPVNIPKVIPIENSDIGTYNLHDGIIIIDEATIFADSRQFKSFSTDLVKLFVMHRHFHLDILCFLQNYNRTDLTIRMLADKVFWIRKFGPMSWCIEIPMSVFIPKKDIADESGTAGEIVNGYYRPPFWSYIFCKKYFRKKYYPYFDSFATYKLPDLPVEKLRHNPDTAPKTNLDYEMDSEKFGKLVSALQNEFNLDLDESVLEEVSFDSEVVPDQRKRVSPKKK